MSVGSYLRLRGGTYHFRVRIPQLLHKAAGRSEMTVSLRTGRFGSAIRAARAIRTELDRIVDAADHGASYADIERRVRAWMGRSALDYETKIALNDGLSGAFSADEAQTMGPGITAEMDGLVRFVGMADRGEAKTAAVRAAAGLISDPRIDGLVQALARDMGFDVEAGSPTAKLVRRAILRNFPTLLDHRDAADLGLPLPDRVLDALQPRPTPGALIARAAEGCTRVTCRSESSGTPFCDAKIDGGEWKSAEKVAARSTLKLWLQSEGEQPICRLIASPRTSSTSAKCCAGCRTTTTTTRSWRSVFDGQGTLALFEAAKAADCARMSPKTFNKHLSRLNEFWKWAAGKGEALPSGSPSIFAGSFVKVQKNRIGRRLRLELRRKFEESGDRDPCWHRRPSSALAPRATGRRKAPSSSRSPLLGHADRAAARHAARGADRAQGAARQAEGRHLVLRPARRRGRAAPQGRRLAPARSASQNSCWTSGSSMPGSRGADPRAPSSPRRCRTRRSRDTATRSGSGSCTSGASTAWTTPSSISTRSGTP